MTVSGALSRLKTRLQRGFGRNVALLIGSTAIGQVAMLATLPVIGRLYTPADMGRLGTFMAFLGTASAATGLRYDIMIVAGESEAEAAALLSGVCAVTVPISLLCTLALGCLIWTQALGFEVLPLAAALWMFPALVVTQLFFTVRYWLMRDGEFPLIARVTIGQNVARAVVPVFAFPIASSWVGLVAGEVIGRCVGIESMLRARGSQLRSALAALRPLDVRRAFRRYPESAFAGLPSALINAASNYLPLPMVAAAFGVAAAGFFGIIQRGMQIPVALISRNVADVFHSRLADQARTAPGGSRRVFWRTGGMLLLIGGLPSLVLALLGPAAFRLVLGPRWDPASRLLVAMIPWTLAAFVVSPLSRAVVVYRGQVQKLWYDVVSLVAVYAVVAPAPKLGWTLEHTVWILSLTQAATYVLYLVILVRLLPGSGLSLPDVSVSPPAR
ncbi:MAG: oligosaccharide flippase family protein [Gemmatimonadales bacterium]